MEAWQQYACSTVYQQGAPYNITCRLQLFGGPKHRMKLGPQLKPRHDTSRRSVSRTSGFRGRQTVGVLCFHRPAYVSLLWGLGLSTSEELWSWHSWQCMLHGYGVTAVAWLYWNRYLDRYVASLFNKMKRGTKQGAAQPKKTGTSLKRLMDYMLPYTCRFVFVMLLVMLSSYGEMAIPQYTGHMTDWIMDKDKPDAFTHGITIMAIITITSALLEFICDILYTVTMSRIHASVQGLIFQSSWQISLFTCMGLPILWVIPELSGSFHQTLSKKVQECVAQANQVATETFSNMKTVRSFANEDGENKRYEEQLDAIYTLNKQESLAYGASNWANSFICDILYTVTMSRIHASVQGLIFQSVLRQEIAFFDANPTGDIVSHITTDTDTMSEALSEELSLVMWYTARLVFILYFMFSQSWQISLFTCMGLPILWVIPELSGSFHQTLSKKVQECVAQANQVATETFSNMKTVRSFANEDGENKRYEEQLDAIYTLNKQESLAYGASNWANNLVSFVLYELQLASAVNAMMRCYPGVRKAIGASEKIFEYMDRKPQIPPEGTLAPGDLKGHVEFKNVTFTYPSKDTPALVKHSNSRTQVLIPALFSPTRAVICPGFISRDTSWSGERRNGAG
ncbi:hypothetical protein CRUP_000885 [Coryphaenoides rupestris]|nr:hypothetical protein CRUP_000885 [Coryphaenoides rupestris]